MALWVARAKSSSITLSLAVEDAKYLSHETFDIARRHPSLFPLVHDLQISSPQSQLYDLFGGTDGSNMLCLESISLIISKWKSRNWTLGVRLCQSAPLLRKLTIRASGLVSSEQVSPGFITAFPWSQLTDLTMKLGLSLSVWMLIFSQCTSLLNGAFIVCTRGPDPHFPTLAFNHLQSLRVAFTGFCNTIFFDHLVFPAIQKLHIAGLVDPHRHIALPTLPHLRSFFLDVPGLSPHLLGNIIGSHPKLEQLRFMADESPDRYAAVFLRLQREYQLRTLTISTPRDEPHLFTDHVTSLVIKQASAFDCDVRLFGKTDTLDVLKNSLDKVSSIQAILELGSQVDDLEDSFAILPWSLMAFLSVRRCATPSCTISLTVQTAATCYKMSLLRILSPETIYLCPQRLFKHRFALDPGAVAILPPPMRF
ncbi:hypothetical protein B0H12DRAFT_1246406 [Mycena haematopus]|nr:hypothetical protein B0H12DRAFT_1246406 [Mycena haematopus]